MSIFQCKYINYNLNKNDVCIIGGKKFSEILYNTLSNGRKKNEMREGMYEIKAVT